jgi:hypothetical protein
MIFFLIVLLVIIGFLIVVLKSKKTTDIEEKIDINASFSKKNVLTTVEQNAYWKIIEAAGNDKIVLAQVSFSSFLKTSGDAKDRRVLFNTARQKVADFVICNKGFEVLKVIEIDDKSHNKDKDSKRDEITEKAGIKTLRYEATNLPSVEDLRKDLQ